MKTWHWIISIFSGSLVGRATHDTLWGIVALILIGVLLTIHQDLVDLYHRPR